MATDNHALEDHINSNGQMIEFVKLNNLPSTGN